MSNYILSHHGIKGQKWYVRRFQNQDGTLTGLGKKRYSVGEDSSGVKRLHTGTGGAKKIDTRKLVANAGDIFPRFGRRRYVDKDGNLTEAGKKRYEKEIKRNNQKSKDKRAKSNEDLKDPTKWASDDFKNTKNVSESTSKALKGIQKLNNKRRDPETPRLDLSKMSDKELRQHIERERLERQYNEMFNPPKVNKGREQVNQILETTGTILEITNGVLDIAVGINEIMGNRR